MEAVMSVKSLGRAVHNGKVKMLLDILVKDYSFKLVSDHKHLVLKSPAGPQIVMPKTTSDGNSWHMTCSTIRKATGIDVKLLMKNSSKKAMKAFRMAA